jgi:RNA polymerase sigma-70 factor (ECF subfamily)
LTDEQLIEQIRNGDDSQFRELVERYKSRVAATVIGILGKCTEAEDIGQETFIRFYRNVKNFRMESTVGTYLTRIAINLSLNELKRRKRRIILYQTSENQLESIAAQTDETQNTDPEIIRKAILKLSPKFRSVLVLRLINEYSTNETAVILQIPQGTVL